MTRARDLADSADLAFDGDTLKIDSTNNRVGIGTSSPSDTLVVDGGTLNGTTYATVTNNHSDQFISMGINANVGEIAVDDGDVMTFGHYNNYVNKTYTERMRIDTSGRLLLGTTSSTYQLDVKTTGNNGIRVQTGTSSADQLYLGNTGGNSAVGTLTNDALTVITNGSERMRIDSNGHLYLKKNLVLESTSEGIDFSGVGSSAETLDDYEEGSFTISVVGESTAGSATYGNRTGFYTKVGRKVTAYGEVSVTPSGAAGHLNITGLPFTSGTASPHNHTVGSCMINNLNVSGSAINVVPFVLQGTTKMRLYTSADNSGWNVVPVENAEFAVYFNVTYFV